MPSKTDSAHESVGLKRSEKWPEVERTFRESHSTCAACDSTVVQVHHVLPFHFAILLGRPDLELDPNNLITLCEKEKGEEAQDHHLLLGHLDDFQSYNKDVRASAVIFHEQDEATIKADAGWQAMAQAKPPVWAAMSDDDKAAMRALMDEWYPLSERLFVEPAPFTEPTPLGPDVALPGQLTAAPGPSQKSPEQLMAEEQA